MTTTRAVIIGESHTNAVAQAIAEDPAAYEGIEVYRLHSPNRPSEPNTVSVPEAVAIIEALPEGGQVFLAMLGTYHNILGLLRAGEDYDFLLDGQDSPDPSATARIPHRAMASAFEQHFAQAGTIKRFRAVAKSAMHVLSSPPPKQSNRYVRHRFMRQTKRAYHGRSVEDVGVERPASRRKLWLMETMAIARWAGAHGMRFVPAPAAAFNGSGFLARKYYFEDATHANARYGALVLQQIRETLEDQVNGPSDG